MLSLSKEKDYYQRIIMEIELGKYLTYGNRKPRQMNIRIPKHIVDDLKVMAVRHNLSLNAYVEGIFTRHIIKQRQYE